jgi:hypothetical protein
MDIPTRVGIGGCGFAVICTLLPFIPELKIPISIVYFGILLGVIIALWGFWPLFMLLSLGRITLWRVPLLDAARICYEKCEGFPIGNWVTQTNKTPHKRLSYFIASFIVNEVPIFGEKPPSNVARQMSVQETKGVISKDETHNFMNLYDSKEIAFRNVYIRRIDLWRHLKYLRKLNSDPETQKFLG